MPVPTTQEIIANITADLQIAFGSDINTAASEPIGTMIGLLAASDSELFQLSDAVRAQLDLSKATGTNLDILGKFFLTTRQQATATIIVGVTLNGTTGTTIPTGNQIQLTDTTSNTDIYELTTAVTLVAGTGTGTYANTIAGARTINNALPFSIITQVTGLDSVDPSVATVTLGQDFEVDNIFRNRLQQSSAKNGSNIKDNVNGALLAVDGISKAKTYEFKTSIDNPNTGTTNFAVGFFEPIVVIATSQPIQDVIDAGAQVIWVNKPLGVISESEGGTAISGTATDILGGSHTIDFTEAIDDPFTAVVSITALPGQSFDSAASILAIQTQLAEYVNGLLINDLAIFSTAFCIVLQAGTGYKVNSFTWGNPTQVIVDIQIDVRSAASITDPQTAIAVTVV